MGRVRLDKTRTDIALVRLADDPDQSGLYAAVMTGWLARKQRHHALLDLTDEQEAKLREVLEPRPK